MFYLNQDCNYTLYENCNSGVRRKEGGYGREDSPAATESSLIMKSDPVWSNENGILVRNVCEST